MEPPAPKSALHTPEVQFLMGCWEVWHALAGPGDAALHAAHGLGLREFIALSHVQAGPTTPAELARVLGLPRYEVSRLLARLEAVGAVTRTRTPADARQVQVGVTPSGRALWAAALRSVQRFVQPALAPLGPDLPALGASLRATAERARQRSLPSLSQEA